MKERQIKRIEYYNVESTRDPSEAAEIFETKSGLWRAENFDTKGNRIRENMFDHLDMFENFVTEWKFDENNNMCEKIHFTNFSNYSSVETTYTSVITYMCKYIYSNNLLVEILSFDGTFNIEDLRGKNTISYNDKDQKIKDEQIICNDSSWKETKIYDWKDEYSYIVDTINERGRIKEREFVKLDKNGKIIELNIVSEISSKKDYRYDVFYERTFDEHGNLIFEKQTLEDKLFRETENKYLYDGENWIYKKSTQYSYLYEGDNWEISLGRKESYGATFRKIEYY